MLPFSKYSLIGLLFGTFLTGYVVFAFSSPGATPPGGNTPAPVNVGSGFQEKQGDLWLRSLGTDRGAVFGGDLLVGGGVKLNTQAAKPVCDSATRGIIWNVQGATNTEDRVETCLKNYDGTYTWQELGSGVAYGQTTYYSYGQGTYPPAKTCTIQGCNSPTYPQHYQLSVFQSACNTYCGATGTVTCQVIAGQCGSGSSLSQPPSSCGQFNFSTCSTPYFSATSTNPNVPACWFSTPSPYFSGCTSTCTC